MVTDYMNGGRPVTGYDMSVRIDAESVWTLEVVREAVFAGFIHHHDSRVIGSAYVTIDVFHEVSGNVIQKSIVVIIFYRLLQFPEFVVAHHSTVIQILVCHAHKDVAILVTAE